MLAKTATTTLALQLACKVVERFDELSLGGFEVDDLWCAEAIWE